MNFSGAFWTDALPMPYLLWGNEALSIQRYAASHSWLPYYKQKLQRVIRGNMPVSSESYHCTYILNPTCFLKWMRVTECARPKSPMIGKFSTPFTIESVKKRNAPGPVGPGPQLSRAASCQQQPIRSESNRRKPPSPVPSNTTVRAFDHVFLNQQLRACRLVSTPPLSRCKSATHQYYVIASLL